MFVSGRGAGSMSSGVRSSAAGRLQEPRARYPHDAAENATPCRRRAATPVAGGNQEEYAARSDFAPIHIWRRSGGIRAMRRLIVAASGPRRNW